jgi:hypothetical protein
MNSDNRSTVLGPEEYGIVQRYVDVATTVAPLIGDLVDSLEDRRLVVQDIVDGWFALPEETQQHYIAKEFAARPALPLFAQDYVERVDQEAGASNSVYGELPDYLVEKVCLLHWRKHIKGIANRLAAGDPPSAEWLEGFPIPDPDDQRDVVPK